MPLFAYIASDNAGKECGGQMAADDRNHLKLQLQQTGLSLVSCFVLQEGSVPIVEGRKKLEEETNEAEDAGIPGRSKKRKWPVQAPSQYALMTTVFIVCMVIGYFVGR